MYMSSLSSGLGSLLVAKTESPLGPLSIVALLHVSEQAWRRRGKELTVGIRYG